MRSVPSFYQYNFILFAFTALLCLIMTSGQSHALQILLKKDFSSPTTKLYSSEQFRLIPDNFNFSQKKSLLGSLYIRLQKVRSKENAQQVSDAIEQLWLTSGSDQIDTLMNNALLAIEEKKMSKAIFILKKITQLNPGFTEAWNKIAMVYFLEKDYNNAMTYLQKVFSLDPKHFQAINGMANILMETGHKKSALKAFRKVLTINPHLQSAKDAEETLRRDIEGQKT